MKIWYLIHQAIHTPSSGYHRFAVSLEKEVASTTKSAGPQGLLRRTV